MFYALTRLCLSKTFIAMS